MIAVALKFAQQIVQALALRHEHRRAQQGADLELGRALQLEQVLGQQDADDVLTLALVNRKPRVASVDHAVQQQIVGIVDIDQIHPRRRHHHVASRHVGHADDALDHCARLGPDDVVLLRLGQGFDQLVGRVRPRMDELSDLLQKGPFVFTIRKARGMRV